MADNPMEGFLRGNLRMVVGHADELQIGIGQVSGQEGGQHLPPAQIVLDHGNALEGETSMTD